MEEDKIMLIKMSYYLKADARNNILNEILSIKERRSLFIPYGAEISYIPKDVKAGNRCLREIDIPKDVKAGNRCLRGIDILKEVIA